MIRPPPRAPLYPSTTLFRALALTAARRPELIESARAKGWLNKADERYLAELAGTYDPATDAPKRRRKPSATPAQPPKTPDAS
ncbi:hypothetical protein G6F35_019063 [Rhizopus arrhizus]|nr:hypothetical protein G6F35_019063 [Rhizopus arrhizus]